MLGGLFIFTPLFDRSLERRPWKRPIAVGAFAGILVGIVTLTTMSYHDDAIDLNVATKLLKQEDDTRQYMLAPFEPEVSSRRLFGRRVALADPGRSKAKNLFEQQSCNACHGDGGTGTAAAPKLVGISAKYSAEQINGLLKHPTAKMTAGGMPTPDLKPEEMGRVGGVFRKLEISAEQRRLLVAPQGFEPRSSRLQNLLVLPLNEGATLRLGTTS